jgi:hypothetical protein
LFYNLYFEVSAFVEFNVSKDPYLQKIPFDYMDKMLWEEFNCGDDESAFDPLFVRDFRTTLSPECCEMFFREQPSVPATHRDYYLSKLFQFWYMAMSQARFTWPTPGLDPLDPERILKSALDQVPDKLLPNVHTRFDIRDVVTLVKSFACDDDLSGLLDSLTVRVLTTGPAVRPERAGRRVSDPVLAAERHALYERYKQAGGTVSRLRQALGGMDRSQVYHYLSGALPPTSTVVVAIENAMRRYLAEKPRFR